MQWGVCTISVFALALGTIGCASQKQPVDKQAERDSVRASLASDRYEPSAAGSLVFDPPVTIGQEPLALARDDRTPGAFVGFESLTTTYFYLRVDDRMIDYPDGRAGDRYERRAVSHTVGVSYR
jgi:hypothetical protein